MLQSPHVLLLLLLILEVSDPFLAVAEQPILLYPEPSVFQFTIGISVPVAMHKRGGVVFSSGFQFNYALPWNLTQFKFHQPMVVRARAEPQLRLENIYTALENLLEKNGWGEGRECILRTICELAETPLARSGEDVVEEIMHLLLTRPSEDSGEADYPGQWSGADSYEEAERLGKSGVGCDLVYRNCAQSPLDFLTDIAFKS